MLNIRLLAGVFLILSTRLTPVAAQRAILPAEKFDWHALQLWLDAGVDYRSANDIKRSNVSFYLPVSENEKIVPVWTSKNEWGLVKLNADGKELWRMLGAKDDLIGIGLLNGDVLAIYTDRHYRPSKVTGVLVNGKNGQKKKEKTIHQHESKGFTRIRVQNKVNGTFSNVMIVTEERKQTSIRVLHIDNDLSVSNQFTLHPSVPVSKFAGSIVNKSSEIFLADFSEEQLTVTKFGKDGKEIGKVTAPVTRTSEEFNSILQMDQKHDGALYVALNYSHKRRKRANQIFHFDLTNGKIIASPEQTLDKDYAQTISLAEIKDTYKGNLNNIERSSIEGFAQWEDKVVLLTEIQTTYQVTSSANMRFISLPWIASIYDSNLKPRKSVGLDKKNENFKYLDLTLGYHVQGHQLLIIASALSGIGKTAATFASINLNTEKIEKATVIENLKMDMYGSLDGKSVLWFNNTFIVPVRNGKNCRLYRVEL